MNGNHGRGSRRSLFHSVGRIHREVFGMDVHEDGRRPQLYYRHRCGRRADCRDKNFIAGTNARSLEGYAKSIRSRCHADPALTAAIPRKGLFKSLKGRPEDIAARGKNFPNCGIDFVGKLLVLNPDVVEFHARRVAQDFNLPQWFSSTDRRRLPACWLLHHPRQEREQCRRTLHRLVSCGGFQTAASGPVIPWLQKYGICRIRLKPHE